MNIQNRIFKKTADFSFFQIYIDTKTSNILDDFKVVFNEGRLGLYLKNIGDDNIKYSNLRGSLVQISKKAIMRAHSHMNYQ